jgi:hypothetical protein
MLDLRGCVLLAITAALVLAAATAAEEEAPALNGFDVSQHGVPKDEIRGGGPARDRVQSVDDPEYVAPDAASWVNGATPVIGVAHAGVARAAPIHLLEYHQVVNDDLGGVPVVITFAPLAGTPRAFLAKVEGKHLHFGVSGLVYNSNFLLYDRETQSLWSQFLGLAIAGPLTGKQLTSLRVHQEPFGVWLGREPDTQVLVRPKPREIDYRYSPYRLYWASETVPFPVAASDERYHPKEVVLGVEVGGVSRAYLGSILTAAGGRIVDEIGGKKIRIAYEGEVANFIFQAPEGVAVTDAYWFAWKAFHPDTEIWKDQPGDEP